MQRRKFQGIFLQQSHHWARKSDLNKLFQNSGTWLKIYNKVSVSWRKSLLFSVKRMTCTKQVPFSILQHHCEDSSCRSWLMPGWAGGPRSLKFEAIHFGWLGNSLKEQWKCLPWFLPSWVAAAFTTGINQKIWIDRNNSPAI